MIRIHPARLQTVFRRNTRRSPISSVQSIPIVQNSCTICRVPTCPARARGLLISALSWRASRTNSFELLARELAPTFAFSLNPNESCGNCDFNGANEWLSKRGKITFCVSRALLCSTRCSGTDWTRPFSIFEFHDYYPRFDLAKTASSTNETSWVKDLERTGKL